MKYKLIVLLSILSLLAYYFLIVDQIQPIDRTTLYQLYHFPVLLEGQTQQTVDLTQLQNANWGM